MLSAPRPQPDTAETDMYLARHLCLSCLGLHANPYTVLVPNPIPSHVLSPSSRTPSLLTNYRQNNTYTYMYNASYAPMLHCTVHTKQQRTEPPMQLIYSCTDATNTPICLCTYAPPTYSYIRRAGCPIDLSLAPKQPAA